MGYTVLIPGGTKDQEFEAYLRLLRQTGVDIGNTPRVPEPGTGNLWLHVWESEESARAFRDELCERTGHELWQVVPVNAEPSQGPLGPIAVLLTKSADNLNFSVHALTRAMIKSAFPEATPSASLISMDLDTWRDYRRTHGNLIELVREIAPTLTGLTDEQISRIGLQLIDAERSKTLESIPPVMSSAL